MEIRDVGITGLMCVLGDTLCEETGRRVSALMRRLDDLALPGVIELIPAYASLLVRYDPLVHPREKLEQELRLAEKAVLSAPPAPYRTVEIPVLYGGEAGPDLADVARLHGLSEEEAVRLHTQAVYPIYMLGFLPGFPYLGGLDERLHTPRLSVPRTRIPAGSVGIGGKQTGIYPMESPGGWRLIGRTPLKLYAPGRPLPYSAGDRIRFVPIGRERYLALEKEAQEDA